MFSSLAEFSAAIMQSRDETKKGARPNPHVVLLGAVGGTGSAEKNPERASRLPQNKKQDKLSRGNSHFLWGR